DSGIDEADEMKRRQFLAYSALLAGGVAVEPNRLVEAAQAGPGVDMRLVDSLEGVVQGYSRQWHVMAPALLLGPVKSQITALNDLRAAARTPPVAARLGSLTAGAAGLAGWLSWLGGNREAAAAYIRFGAELAGEVRDDDTHVLVLVLRSFMSSPLFGSDPGGSRMALPLLD